MRNDEGLVFVEDSPVGGDYSAIFEATDGSDEDTPPGGYLYLFDNRQKKILGHLEIYKIPAPEIRDADVQLFWSDDGTKCGVAIWGRMRGIIDVSGSPQVVAPMDDPASPGITDPMLLKAFSEYMDQVQFIRARQKFWKQKLLDNDPDAQPLTESESSNETNFIVVEKGADCLFAVFEDDGDTGYLYIFDASEPRVLQYLQIYDQAKRLKVQPDDVRLIWSEDTSKCGVLIWDRMRGIVDRIRNQEGRVKLEGRETPGIGDPEWLSGFEH